MAETPHIAPRADHGRAVLALAATALLWSSGGLAIKLADLPPMAITGARSALSALTLALLFRHGLSFRLTPARVGAALCYAGLMTLNVAATKLTTSANAILLAYTAPVYVALLAPRLLGERTKPSDWLFVGLVLAGMGLFFLDKLSAQGLVGNLLAVASGLCYAGFTLFMRAQKDASPVESVILGHGVTAVAGLPFLAAALPGMSGGALWSTLAGLAYLGVLQQGVSLGLYVWSIKRLGALEAILVMTLEPILNPVWVALGVGELPGLWACAGGLVVLCAVTARGLAGARSQARARA